MAACVDLGVYQLLLLFGTWAPLAKGISFILGTTTAYLLNRRFTFASSSGGGTKFLGFLLLYGSTFAVNVAVAVRPGARSTYWSTPCTCTSSTTSLVTRRVTGSPLRTRTRPVSPVTSPPA